MGSLRIPRERRRTFATTSGMLLAGVGLPVAATQMSFGSVWSAPRWAQITTWLLSSLLIVAGFGILRRATLVKPIATAAGLGMLGLGHPYLLRTPFAALAAVVACTMGVALLWEDRTLLARYARSRRRPVCVGQAHGASVLATGLGMLVVLTGGSPSEEVTFTVACALGVSALLTVEWCWRARARHPLRATLLAFAALLGAMHAAARWPDPWAATSGMLGVSGLSAVLLGPAGGGDDEAPWFEPLVGHPARLLTATFLTLSLAGTVLLALPQSAAGEQPISLLEAAFTATSAVCVTGLAVLDTAGDFSAFGQVMILLLIQVGGLGIMTFSTAAVWALGRRFSLRQEGALATLLSTEDRGQLFASAQRILLFTFAVEAAGAVLLAFAFMTEGDSLPQAVWRGVFTSISAFCNAGFALQSDSLVGYRSSPWVLHVVGVLIIMGSLSPLTVFRALLLMQRSTEPIPAQPKLSLAATGALLLGGFVFMLAFEWDGTLSDLSFADRLHNAWFQSVTLRTAGFNSIDFSNLRPATLTLMLLWMFVGGSPGGTAGGIKTTTASILTLSALGAMRGQWTLETFGKRVPERTRAKAAVIASVAIAATVFALLTIQLTQEIPTRAAIFEVVSALGTVGLSVGATSQLDEIGRIVIIVCMFTGRVGVLTLFMFLSEHRELADTGRPPEEIDVG